VTPPPPPPSSHVDPVDRRRGTAALAQTTIDTGVWSLWKYVDFKKVAVITNENLEEACRQQGVAIEAGDKGMF